MEEPIRFDNQYGESLAGTLHRPEGLPVGGIVAGHCFTCSRHTGILRQICKALSGAGFIALRFDFSGNGQSQGEFERSTWSKQIMEMQKAIELLRNKGAAWIGLAGHSLGAAIALLTARRTQIVSAICRVAGRMSAVPPMHFLTPSQQQDLVSFGRVEFTSRGRPLTLTRYFFDDAKQHDLMSATQDLPIPMLVVHGEQDNIIPVSEAYLAKTANPQRVELSIVPDGDHMLSRPEHQRLIASSVTEWFCRQAGVVPSDDRRP